MIRKEKNGLTWLEFEIFQPFKEIKHGVLTRHFKGNGASEKLLDLNTASPQIQENIKKIQDTFSLKKMIYGTQVHKNRVEEIDDPNPTFSFECDAFVTQLTQISLLIKHADCQAALFYDPIQKVIANAHCGWRGSILNIYRDVIQKMKRLYRCKPQNICVGISPSLGPINAEFKNYRQELPQNFWDFQIKPNFFDFWEITKNQLVKEGISSDHIEIAQICTYECTQDFFSYRKEKTSGRNGTFITQIPLIL